MSQLVIVWIKLIRRIVIFNTDNENEDAGYYKDNPYKNIKLHFYSPDVPVSRSGDTFHCSKRDRE